MGTLAADTYIQTDIYITASFNILGIACAWRTNWGEWRPENNGWRWYRDPERSLL